MGQKFKAGDKCRIVNFGHPLHVNKTQWQISLDPKLIEINKPDNILFEDDKFYVIDIAPDYVGQEVTIKGSYFDLYGSENSSEEKKQSEQNMYSTSLFAWAKEAQLELI